MSSNSKKLSELNNVTATHLDSIVYVADTSDNGSSYSGKQIRVQDLIADILAKSDLGVFTGDIVADNATIKAALQSIENELESQGGAKADASVVNEISGNVDDLVTLSGVSENDTDLGVFSGSTLSDNETVKGALQELEVAHEAEIANRVAAIQSAVNNLVDSAPGTLDTLNEIAAALNDDPSIATTLTNLINTEATNRANAITQEQTDRASAVAAEAATRLAADVALTANKVARGENIDELVADTTAATEPAAWYFLAVDASDGSIKVINKSYMEIE